MSRESVSSIIIAIGCVRLCTFARPHPACRHALKNIKEYLLGQVELSQIHPIAVNCIHNYNNSSCLNIIHKS